MEAQTDYSAPKRGSLVNTVTGHLSPELLFEDVDMTWCCNRAPSRKEHICPEACPLSQISQLYLLSGFFEFFKVTVSR